MCQMPVLREDSVLIMDGAVKLYRREAANGHQLYMPIGFPHGFVTLKPDSEIVYKCTDYYAPGSEGPCGGTVVRLSGLYW